jgi:TonB family protein
VRVWFEVKQAEGAISVSQPADPAIRPGELVLRRVAGDEPAYPYEARKRGLSADVESLLRVMPTGEVHSVAVVPGPVIRFFRRPVAETLMRWRFEPHAAGGSVCYRVEHRFRGER